MKFEIKHVEIIDGPGTGSESGFIQCHVEIGEKGSLGADIFFVDVCNPKWVERHLDRYMEQDRHITLVVDSFSETNIANAVTQRFLEKEYESFLELVKCASPLMRWEFS